MKLDTLVLGDYGNNCYVLRADASATDCLIIDTGFSPEPLLDFLRKNKLTPVALILTHGHCDHIAGAGPLRKLYPQMKIAVHKADSDALPSASVNLAAMIGEDVTSPPADIFLEEGTNVEFAGISLRVIHTPGHTPGCACFYSAPDKMLFAGDTLFAGSVGRTDFPNSSSTDHQTLVNNIKMKLLTLPPETKVFSGHGPATTIRNEIKHNPHLQD
jgi:glyoxylase-like metal-dependent hydrolase (beta-lactamase superfamily II)